MSGNMETVFVLCVVESQVPGAGFACATKSCMVAPNSPVSSAWKLCFVMLVAVGGGSGGGNVMGELGNTFSDGDPFGYYMMEQMATAPKEVHRCQARRNTSVM